MVDEEAPTITSAQQWNADFAGWLDAYRQAAGAPLDAVVFDIDWRMPWQNWVSPSVAAAHKAGVRAGMFLTGTGPGVSDADAIAARKQNALRSSKRGCRSIWSLLPTGHRTRRETCRKTIRTR